MPTVIDELIVTLGLDASKFTQGQKDAVESFKKTKDAANKNSKEIEGGADKMSEAFKLLQGRLLGIAAIFLGGMGLKEFAEHITKATSQTGYLSKQLGISAQELSEWAQAGKRVGATAEDITASVQGMVGALAEGQLHGVSGIQKYLMAMNISSIDPKTGKWKTPTQIYTEMARWGQGQDPRLASQLWKEMGQSPGMINLLLQGPEKLNKYLEEAKRNAPSDEEIKKFQHLQEAFGKASNDAEALSRTIFVKFIPAIENVISFFERLIKVMEPYVGGGPEKKAEEFTKKNYPEMSGSDKSLVGRFKNWWNNGKGNAEPGDGKGNAEPGGSTSAPSPPRGSTFDERFRGESSSAPVRGTKTGWWTPERKQYAVNYLMTNANLPEVSARAMVGRWAGVEASGGPSEVNSIGAMGIAQWLGDRKKGVVLGDFDNQLGHTVRELRGKEARSYQTLMEAKTEREAAIGASQFERAEGYNGHQDMFVDKTIRAMRGVPGQSQLSYADWGKSASALPFINPHPGLMALKSEGDVSHNNTTSSTSVNNLNVYSRTDDPQSHASDIKSALTANSWMNQSNMGPN